MGGAEMPRVEIDGRPADVERLRAVALAGYGHFTAMQVRDGRVRGLGLHLDRLASANREVFGTGLDGGRVRDLVRHALGTDVADASVRVLVRWPEADPGPVVMVVVRPPQGMMGGAHWRLRSVPYQRSVAHIKHIDDFGQSYYGRLARREGFDEALLTGPGGVISEGAITNIGFFDGNSVVWPAAPVLSGITMQLLAAGLPDRGLPVLHRPLRLADLGGFAGGFVCNSRGVAPVRQIDDRVLPIDVDLNKQLTDVYESTAWDRI